MPTDPSNPDHWSGENKLAVVIDTVALNAQELAVSMPAQGPLPGADRAPVRSGRGRQ